MITSRWISPWPLIQLQVFSNYPYLAVPQVLPIHHISSYLKLIKHHLIPANCSFGTPEFWHHLWFSELFFLTFSIYLTPSANATPFRCFPRTLTPHLPFLTSLSYLNIDYSLKLKAFCKLRGEEPNIQAAELSFSWEKKPTTFFCSFLSFPSAAFLAAVKQNWPRALAANYRCHKFKSWLV